MRFAKYQGTGNDFVMIADLQDEIALTPELARALSDRRFGIGADGVIRVASGRDGAKLFMDYFNADGSTSEMCGNGIRCLAIFALEQGLTTSHEMRVGTGSGVKTVEVLEGDLVRVDMGPPVFKPRDIPVRWEGDNALDATVELPAKSQGGDGSALRPIGDTLSIPVACLSMGNPHAVVDTQALAEVVADEDPVQSMGSGFPTSTFGPLIERHEMFPNKTNVEFVRVESPEVIDVGVWERGSGQTWSCGTGACAAAVAMRVAGRTGARVTVRLAGGPLVVEWSGSLDREAPVFLTGPAQKTFDGKLDLG